MSKRAYQIIVLISIVIGIILYLTVNENNQESYMWVSLVPFFLFVAGFHGMLTYTSFHNHPFYPFLMGAIFVGLLLLHLYVMLASLCPCFLH